MVADGLTARLADLEREHAECEARLADPEVIADQRRYVELSRRYSELGPIVARTGELRVAEGDLAAAKELYSMASAEEREALRGEVDQLERRVAELGEELKVLLLPQRPQRRHAT